MLFYNHDLHYRNLKNHALNYVQQLNDDQQIMNANNVQRLLNHPIKDLDDMPEMFKYSQQKRNGRFFLESINRRNIDKTKQH